MLVRRKEGLNDAESPQSGYANEKVMLDEFELEEANGTLYLSPRLSSAGSQDYGQLLREAIAQHDDASLADALWSSGRMNEIESTVRGPRRVPHTAPETLAEGEFNRFYARGLSSRAIKEEVLRLAGLSSKGRVESSTRGRKQSLGQRSIRDLSSPTCESTLDGHQPLGCRQDPTPG
jgi:hypothetical protein